LGPRVRAGVLRGGAVFKRILVPIDLSDRNTRTIDVALELARQNRALVTLCHVIQSVRNVPSAELRKFYKRLEATSAGTLARVAKRFTAREVPVDTVVCIGEPAREIVRLAAGRRIDLIVMGSHKVRAGRWATGWGTISYKVGIFCRCPVLLVK
jgi:nucleotide-binding universal stress UspA family protein